MTPRRRLTVIGGEIEIVRNPASGLSSHPPKPAPLEQVPAVLNDLPAPRVRSLVWQSMEFSDLDAIEERVRERARWSCRVGEPRLRFAFTSKEKLTPVGAALGSDGRYHLLTAAAPACGEVDDRSVISHRRHYVTYRHGDTYRSKPAVHHRDDCQVCGHRWSSGEDRWSHWERVTREHEWTARLSGEVVDPALVPLKQRCEAGRWPAFRHPTSRRGAVVARLIKELGPNCHICQRSPGMVVDHDHFSGLVRGLLCIDCNGFVDGCGHIFGCGFADYLNTPPAAPLAMLYPKMRKSESDKRKEDMLRIFSMGNLPVLVELWPRWTPRAPLNQLDTNRTANQPPEPPEALRRASRAARIYR
jgi:hypothetical protein